MIYHILFTPRPGRKPDAVLWHRLRHPLFRARAVAALVARESRWLLAGVLGPSVFGKFSLVGLLFSLVVIALSCTVAFSLTCILDWGDYEHNRRR